MDTKQSFRVGAKLIGLYYLIMALPVLLGLVGMVLPMFRGGMGALNDLGLQIVPVLFGPVLLGAVGLYVLRDGALFQRLACSQDDRESPGRTTKYFNLGVKLLGVHLILGNIPALGRLFRSVATTKKRTEVLIFLTPHLVTGDRLVMGDLPKPAQAMKPYQDYSSVSVAPGKRPRGPNPILSFLKKVFLLGHD